MKRVIRMRPGNTIDVRQLVSGGRDIQERLNDNLGKTAVDGAVEENWSGIKRAVCATVEVELRDDGEGRGIISSVIQVMDDG